MDTDNFLRIVGAFSIILCVTVILLFPLVLAFVAGTVWLWTYCVYAVIILLYILLILAVKADEKATHRKGIKK